MAGGELVKNFTKLLQNASFALQALAGGTLCVGQYLGFARDFSCMKGRISFKNKAC
jgi:hypothetical protein